MYLFSTDSTIDVSINCTYKTYSNELDIHVTWDYVGDCSTKSLLYVGEPLWDYQHPVLSVVNIEASEGETGNTIYDAVPYTKYTFVLKMDEWDSNATYNGTCRAPQIGEKINHLLLPVSFITSISL